MNKKLSFILISAILFGVLFFWSYWLSFPQNKKDNARDLKESQCQVKVEERIVRGSSLSPLVKDGQKIKVLFGYYKCHPVKRNDIILYHYPPNKNPLIKIVKAVPSDKWSIKKVNEKCMVVVNNKVLKNSEGKVYLFPKNRCKMLEIYAKSYPVIPDNAYLILGNKTSGSLDSTRFGLVGKKDITGKVVLEVWRGMKENGL